MICYCVVLVCSCLMLTSDGFELVGVYCFAVVDDYFVVLCAWIIYV